MSRLDSRAYRWYALCVPPQREFAVERILGQAGFAVFVPTRTEWRFANRSARKKKSKREITYPLMPRYVFVGMNEGTPGWADIWRFRIVTSVIWDAGKPYEVPHDTRKGSNGHPDRPGLRDLMWQHNAGQFRAPGEQQYMQTRREFEVGDSVLTDDGLFEGRVAEIEGKMARVFVDIFGGSREIKISLDKLVAIV